MGSHYLFHEHAEQEWDLGEKTLNCGRRVDVFKLWISWKVQGDNGFATTVDHAFDQAEYMSKQLMLQQDKFRMVKPSFQSLNVCFWYIPPSLRGKLSEETTDEKSMKSLGEATLTIRKRIQLEGKLLLNYADLQAGQRGEPAMPYFFRMITCNPASKPYDMDFVLSEIDRLGSDL